MDKPHKGICFGCYDNSEVSNHLVMTLLITYPESTWLGMVVPTFDPSMPGQKQVDLFGVKASLVYQVSSRLAER